MFGLHWGLVPVMLNNLALHGFDTIKPAAATATFASAGAAFGVFLKTKDKKLKSFALSTMVPALFAGVTEPIVYGISIKYKRPLVASLIARGFDVTTPVIIANTDDYRQISATKQLRVDSSATLMTVFAATA